MLTYFRCVEGHIERAEFRRELLSQPDAEDISTGGGSNLWHTAVASLIVIVGAAAAAIITM